MNNKFDYIECESFQNFATIEVNEIAGMVNLAVANNIKFIFKTGLLHDGKTPEVFFFPLKSIVYKIKSNGYLTLDDYLQATEKKFPSATEYYHANQQGFDIYEEYKHAKSAGDGNKENFEKAKTKGFVKHYENFLKKYEKYKSNEYTASIPNTISSPIELYEFADSKGFSTYHEFEKSYDAGYPDITIYTDAHNKGFKSASHFFDAIKKGFSLPTDYETAKSKHIASKKEFDDYRYLKSGNFRNYSFDEYHFISLLRELENGKKMKLSELFELLIIEQEQYKRTFNGGEGKVLPIWYTQNIGTVEKFESFIRTHAEIKKMGTYNETDKVFELIRFSKTKVYIDASNVAHNSANNKSKGVFFRNIRLVIRELEVWGFKEIIVIADASLRHKAQDKEELDKFKKQAEYYESPSQTSADEFLLEAIHHDKCFVVSNDSFSDWKLKDNWVKQNIDKVRIPFMIKEERVTFSNIEQFAKQNED